MKPEIIYKCELCGNFFTDIYRAIECEKRHVKIAECMDVKYSHGNKYPQAIYVRMEDDAFIKYAIDESWLIGGKINDNRESKSNIRGYLQKRR